MVGAGLVGLATTLSLARRGVQVLLFSHSEAGAASPAAAGMLAPGMEHATGEAHRFALAAREYYPDFLDALESITGERVLLDQSGVLEVLLDDAAAEAAAEADAERNADANGGDARPRGEWIDATTLRAAEPALAHARGAFFYARDGYVDNVHLVHALEAAVAQHRCVSTVQTRVTALEWDGRAAVVRGHDVAASAHTVVLAAGAWSASPAGLPRALPVTPVRGQLALVESAPLAHVAYGPHSYAVPRAGRTVVGSTMERVGFDATVTAAGLTSILVHTATLCPALAGAAVHHRWAGLRPVTPDLLPILGRDPDLPQLVYACGHSRNGILLGPLSAECVAAAVANEEPPHSLRPFRASRFMADGAAHGMLTGK